MCTKEQGNKNQKLDWVIQLYEGGLNEILVDMRLVRGHPLTFICFSSRLYSSLQNLLNS